MPGPTILYVEDDPDLSEVVCELLSNEGYLAVAARDGRQALLAIDAGLRPRVIVTDLMMPELDGFGFLREYRRRPPPHAPVLAVSAFEPYLLQAVAAGADVALAKPVAPTLLLSMLAELAAGRPAQQAPPLAPATPALEERRLEAVLRLGLEQGPPSASLAAFAERVARIFGVPMCLVSVVTRDRQRWLGACGMPEPLTTAGGTDRRDSFCTHAVAARAALVVEDAASNPFFAGNRLVQEHGLRFYAGVPLLGRRGDALGTLCILDRTPVRFGYVDLELLGTLAARVVGELERDEREGLESAPPTAFRSLLAYDTELDVLGRHTLEEAARLESYRAMQHGWPLAVGVMVLPTHEPRAAADAVRAELGAVHLGRLGSRRLGVAAPRLDATALAAALRRACGPDAQLAVRDVHAPFLDWAPLAEVEAMLGDSGMAVRR